MSQATTRFGREVCPIRLGESPIYIVGPEGLKAMVRPDPGW